MSKKIIIKDLKTGEEKIFNSQSAGAEWMNSVSGLKLHASNICRSLSYKAPIGKKRFLCKECQDQDIQKKPKPPRTKHKKRKNGWEFWQFKESPNVIVAETIFNWYDEERLEDYRFDLRPFKVFIHYELEKNLKHHTRLELYKKFDDGTLFEDKITALREIIDRVIM